MKSRKQSKAWVKAGRHKTERKQLVCKDCYTPMITSKGRRCADCQAAWKARPRTPKKKPVVVYGGLQ